MSDHSGDELFAKFYAALDEMNFFKTSSAGAEDPGQLSKATQYFNEASMVNWSIFLLRGLLIVLHLSPPFFRPDCSGHIFTIYYGPAVCVCLGNAEFRKEKGKLSRPC